MMTLADRAAAFNGRFPQYPAAHLHLVAEHDHAVLYGRWVLGNDYRNRADFYGAYPPGLLARITAIFPDVVDREVLHVFSGSLPPGAYTRCDLVCPAELACSVYELPERTTKRFRLIVADPPYSKDDAEQYGTPMIDRARAVAAIAAVTAPGGFVCWLDTCWPMHAKRVVRTVGRVAITRSTNHRVRDLTIFERVEAGE